MDVRFVYVVMLRFIMLISGTFSPRTISLASSIKLQQELEYHIERLGDIEKEMETVSQTALYRRVMRKDGYVEA